MRYQLNVNSPKELLNEYQQALKNEEHVDNGLDQMTLAEKHFGDLCVTVRLYNMFDAFIRITVENTYTGKITSKDIHTLKTSLVLPFQNDIIEINLNQGA